MNSANCFDDGMRSQLQSFGKLVMSVVVTLWGSEFEEETGSCYCCAALLVLQLVRSVFAHS